MFKKIKNLTIYLGAFLLAMLPAVLSFGVGPQSHHAAIARKKAAGGGPLDNIKSEMLAWYDITDGSGTEDRTDQHGVSADLALRGSGPSYAADYAVCDASNGLEVPSSVDPAPTPSSDSGTIILACRPIDFNTGDYPMSDVNTRQFFRDNGGEWYAEFNAITQTTTGAAPANGTDIVLGMTWTAGSPGTIEKWEDGSSIGTNTGTGTSPVNPLRMTYASSTRTCRIYWVAFWTRKLTDAEMAELTSTSTVYADLP